MLLYRYLCNFHHKHTELPAKHVLITAITFVGPASNQFPTPRSPLGACINWLVKYDYACQPHWNRILSFIDESWSRALRMWVKMNLDLSPSVELTCLGWNYSLWWQRWLITVAKGIAANAVGRKKVSCCLAWVLVCSVGQRFYLKMNKSILRLATGSALQRRARFIAAWSDHPKWRQSAGESGGNFTV